MMISGTSLVAGERSVAAGKSFRAINPATGETLGTEFFVASSDDVRRACAAASEAAPAFAALNGKARAAFLREIARRLSDRVPELAAHAVLETALDPARLTGEVTRTARQLTLFAEDLEEGSWPDARIETADPHRRPTPKPDHRSMRVSLGPVAVFGASNFPFAYSVSGCDTAAAFAAGCPVVAKAHPAHPGVSALTGAIITDAVRDCGLPPGVFSLLFDDAYGVGRELVTNDPIRAVAFTGSRRGGRSLMDLAAARTRPVPVYAEMGASNPVFLLPGALRVRADEIVAGLHAACTSGAGQFCTKPGLIIVQAGPETEVFLEKFAAAFRATPGAAMLSPAIHGAYVAGVRNRMADPELTTLAHVSGTSSGPCVAGAALFLAEAPVFLRRPELGEEIFGPASLVVRCSHPEEMPALAHSLEGGIAGAIHAEPDETGFARKLFAVLAERMGRVVFNGHTTGVEVSRAIVHGGPYPATSDGRTSSVGATASLRFTRRVCFQNTPDAFLPPELRDANPLGITRLVDGVTTAGPLVRNG